ncbi:D-alanine--D-alanine ligase [Ekhidna lutea]|uniref:D-alanine--D-alanine ligase n=1 Tax=Ekhidna lutea TaxID=447679 RepID=A0A239LH64_EKHLU|nr:D-alanine--D-alanine ligase family protein [Ekhidna lutea]SNT29705.1 D-alanine--D-alanine ligase [Ekhidna lutea]
MRNLLILCGGQSPEHEISVRSTKNILAAIDRSKYSITLIGISKAGMWKHLDEGQLLETVDEQGEGVKIVPGASHCFETQHGKLPGFDVCFPILHGPNGEDGTIQGLLRLMNIPFVGPSVLASAASMDKDVTKRLLRDSGLMVANWILIHKGEGTPSFEEVEKQLGSVVFVKPANMGSSVGVHRVTNKEEWDVAISDALAYDKKVLVEQAINGRELECAVLGNDNPKATGVGEVQSGDFYSYEEKYASGSDAEIVIPAKIDEKYLPALKQTAVKAYKVLDCEGLARVDMFLTEEGTILVNEINTIPGFTSISMYPKLWEEEGLSYADLIDRLIELAIERGTGCR